MIVAGEHGLKSGNLGVKFANCLLLPLLKSGYRSFDYLRSESLGHLGRLPLFYDVCLGLFPSYTCTGHIRQLQIHLLPKCRGTPRHLLATGSTDTGAAI